MNDKKEPSRTTNRRDFFRRLLDEGAAFYGECRGVPAFKLEELPGLPDTELAKLVPILRSGTKVFVSDETIKARSGDGREETMLVPATLQNIFIIQRFDGHETVKRISGELSRHLTLTQEEAFAVVRDLFLKLVEKGFCHPAFPP